MELEAQLSSPGRALKHLLTSWQDLPAGEPSGQIRARKQPERAEDRLGPDGVAQLCADYQAGMATRQLMQAYGLGKGSVLRLLAANGIRTRDKHGRPRAIEH